MAQLAPSPPRPRDRPAAGWESASSGAQEGLRSGPALVAERWTGRSLRRLLRAMPRACTRSRDPELALDRGIDPAVHPALDRLIDRAREVSPAAEAHRDLIGEVQAVPAIEEVADGMIAATGALRDPRYSKRPRLIGLGV